MELSALEFAAGLVLVLAGSRRLPDGIDGLAERLRVSSGHLGLLMALGANSPEITAAVTALVSGKHDAGYGVVFGSNLFNLAGLLGVGALVAGRVELRRPTLALHGGVAVAITVAAIAVVFGWLPPYAAALLISLFFAPYFVLLGLSPATLSRLPGGSVLASAVSEEERAGREEKAERDEREHDRDEPASTGGIARLLAPSLIAIIVGGIIVMRGALDLAARIGVSGFLVGALLLAALTGLPNVYTALRLARDGRGRAVVSETLNSNTLNLIVGIALPALVFGAAGTGAGVELTAAMLLAATLVALGLTAIGGGLRRRGGLVVVGLYLAFVLAAVLVS